MKETLKFLKFGLIGVASVTAISTLAISCKKSEDNKIDINNQEQVKQTLEAAKKAFEITSKGNHSKVFASDITNNETKLKEYFNVTPGKGFGEDKGFIYKFKSAKPKGTSSLDVVYDISYKDTKETIEVTKTLTQFKDKLVYAESTFNLKAKQGSNISDINPNTITDEVKLKTYFDFEGTFEDVTYQFLEAKPSGENDLKVKYRLSYEGVTKDKTISLTGFRDVNWIDYDYNNKDDFFSIALNKEHLNTIAFAAQQYNYIDHIKKGWTLDFEGENGEKNYKLTKTDKYIMFNGEKHNVWKIHFTTNTPISTIFLDYPTKAPFTAQGKEYYDKNDGFQIAIKDGESEIV